MIKVTRLPNDATSCRQWKSALIAPVSRVDMTQDDVLARYVAHCFEGGSGSKFRKKLHSEKIFVQFNKHLAAELIQPDVLATNVELSHELNSYAESCSLKRSEQRQC